MTLIRPLCFLLMILFLPVPTIAFGRQQPDFLRTINQGRRMDPYNPRVKSGHILGGVQIGSHADYSLNNPDRLFVEYYHSSINKYYLVLPDNDVDFLTLGGSYMLGNLLGDKTWIGAELELEESNLSIFLRGIVNQNRRAKFYYKGYFSLIEKGTAIGGHGGYYTRPFRKSKNTFIDARAALLMVSQDYLDSTTTNVYGEIGHGWARFLNKKGLELYGAVGLEYSSTNVSIDVTSTSESYSDVDLRITIGIQYGDRFH